MYSSISGTIKTDIMAYNPFLVIDGIGYRTKYEPCQMLNSYANRLLDKEDANIILEESPVLAVVSDNISISALWGSYSWQKAEADGTTTSSQADRAHPLDCRDLFSRFETTEQVAVLNYTEGPDRLLSARCWNRQFCSCS